MKFLLLLGAHLVAAPRIFSTCPDSHLSDFGGRFFRAEMLLPCKLLVVEAVQQEIDADQVQRLQRPPIPAVLPDGCLLPGQEFNQDLADNADTGLSARL